MPSGRFASKPTSCDYLAVTETDLTDFVVTNAVDAARRVLVERDHFELGSEALAQPPS